MGVAMTMNVRFGGNSDYEDDNNFETLKHYKPCSIDELVNRTKFNRKEIKLLYQSFKQECPFGILNEETFKNIYRQFFPFADTSIYAHLIFSTFDLQTSNFITFEDFLICLSTLCRGTIEDRLKWIFTLYDTKKSGKLTIDDFHRIICAVYSLLGNITDQQYYHEIIRKHTKNVFQKFDRLHQGYVTIKDFISLCLEDPLIIESINALCTIV